MKTWEYASVQKGSELYSEDEVQFIFKRQN